MQARGARWILFVVLVAAGLGAGLLTWDVQRRVADLEATAADTDARAGRMLAALAALASAQQAYVAPGQPDGPWVEQVSSLVQALSDEAAAARPRLRAQDAAVSLQGATEALASFVEIDGRVRENLALGQELLAADLIFTEAGEMLDRVRADVRAMRDAEGTALASQRRAATTQQWAALGGSALLWVIGLALLVRTPAPRQPITAAEPRPAPAPAVEPLAAPSVAPIEAPPTPAVDLGAAADLCIAIGRMTTTTQLPDLLARAAAVLEASGLIVWMSAGEELFAVTAHGYDPRVIARLGPIARDAENATAAAWRTGEITAVPGGGGASGAIVAPMFGPDACIGVLAAEIRNGRENDAAARAVTAMIAAQLATAVSAWPAASTPPAAATGT